MQLRIRARSIDLQPETRAAIERRLRLAVGRFSPGIVKLQLTLSALPNSSEQSPGNHCRIDVHLGRGKSLTIEDEGMSPQAAAAAATWRLQHRLQHHLAAPRLA